MERCKWRDRLARGVEAKKEHVNQERASHAAAPEVMKPAKGFGMVTFGKYKGKKTFDEVLSKDRSYFVFSVVVKNKEVIFFLHEKGILAQFQIEAEAMR